MNNKLIKESWEELLVKPYPEIREFSWDSNIIKHFLPNILGVFKGDKYFLTEFIKPIAYSLDGIYLLINLGDIKKTKDFHQNKNPLFKYFERKIIEENNKKFKKYVEGDRVNVKGIYLPIISKEDIGRSIPDEI